MESQLDEVMDIAIRQLLIGLAWWSASCIALYIALGSSGTSVLWYGGCLVALFNWYRFGKILFISKLVLFNFFKGVRAAIFIGTIAIVGFTGTYIGPEAMRVSDPGIGTCWAEVDSNEYSPIACWSEESVYQTISVVSSDSSCPSNTDSVFPPDENDSQYHCLKSV
jgi:hypothetical protein